MRILLLLSVRVSTLTLQPFRVFDCNVIRLKKCSCSSLEDSLMSRGKENTEIGIGMGDPFRKALEGMDQQLGRQTEESSC